MTLDDDVTAIAIDELHFFPDAPAQIKMWQRYGLAICATTIAKGVHGETMQVLQDLQETNIDFRQVKLFANCDIWGT